MNETTAGTLLPPEHFDLALRLQQDDDLKFKIDEHLRRMAQAEGEVRRTADIPALRHRLLFELWKDCGNNSSLMAPWFFPRYPRDTPFSLMDRPFNMILMFMLPYYLVTLRGSRQIGKALPLDEPVLTPAGWRPIGTLQPGDLVIGADGHPHQVTGVHDQGLRDTFEITFEDGASVKCDAEHNWLIRRAGSQSWVVETLQQIIDKSGTDPSSSLAVCIPLNAPAQFPASEHRISPYMMGALLGGGNLRNQSLYRGCVDHEILQRIEVENDVTFASGKNGRECFIRSGTGTTWLLTELKDLGLEGCRECGRFIPRSYLFDSADNRLALLQGLLDTYGRVVGKRQIALGISSLALAEGVVYLVRSLGGKAIIKERSYKTARRKKTYRVICESLPINPFHLKRKADKFHADPSQRVRALTKVRPAGKRLCRCITVASPDHTFITRDFIVTHNTTTYGVLLRLNAHMVRNLSQIYLAPHLKPLETFSRKFLEIEQAFRHPVRGSKFKQNMYYKTYPTGSKLDMVRVQSSATPVRGKTADVLVMDEVQLFDPALETEVLEVLNDSLIKIAMYAGTSTTTESLLEVRYQEGCQATWMIDLGNGQYLDCGDYEAVMPYIGPYCMRDPKTETPINPSRGFYTYKNPEAFIHRNISVHVPQLINPSIYGSPLEWSRLHSVMIKDPKKFVQEKMGIPVADAHHEISENDLRRICVLPEGPEARKKKCRDRYYRLIVSGFDWGGSDYNELLKTKVSATTHAILGVAPDNRIDILHIKRHAGKSYTQILLDIVGDHLAHRAGPIGSDFGGGQQYHALLRTHPMIDPTRHVIFDYDDPDSPLCRTSKTSQLTNMLLLNKTESITALYLAFKMADPVFRAPSWLEMEDYLKDFLNMTRVLVDKEQGQRGRRFVYHRLGTKTDDVVHAINFAYSLIRLAYDHMLIQDPGAAVMIRNAAFATSGVSAAGSYANALKRYTQSLGDLSRGLH